MAGLAISADEDKPFYPSTWFLGTISYQDRQADCAFIAKIGSDGRIIIDFEDIPYDNNSSFLLDFFAGKSLTNYSLAGTSEKGDHLASNSLFLKKITSSFDAHKGMVGYCTNAKILQKKGDGSEVEGRITYWLRGFRGRPIEQDTRLGKLLMAGADREDTEKINSALELCTSYNAVSGEQSRRELVDFLDHLVWFMSFASGTMLRDPVRVFAYRDTVELEIRRHTTAPAAFYRPIDHMQQQPFFSHAALSYFDRRKECEEMRIVIEFLLVLQPGFM